MTSHVTTACRTLSARFVATSTRPLVTAACFRPIQVPRNTQLALLTKRADLTSSQLPAVATRKRAEADDKQTRQLCTATTAGIVSDSPSFGQYVVNRTLLTTEVLVSKIFPAGFGWQAFSVIADSHMGLAGDSLGFYLMTGLGDGLFVAAFHTMYYAIKKAIYDGSINLAEQFQTGVLLGSAAFCSGSAWQFYVNTFGGLGFNGCLVTTGSLCGLTFFGGLRAGRMLLPSIGMQYVEPPTYQNLKNDASLSVSIGGATAFFVGTDAGSLAGDNFLRGIVGIEDHLSDVEGMCRAGLSTTLGFAALQLPQNVAYSAGKNWTD